MGTKQTWQNRIVGHAEVDPNELKGNPLNWRLHSDAQRKAMRGVLNEVGWVQEVIVNKQTGVLVDGHLRLALAIERKEAKIPVKYVDLDASEEALILATLDPIGAMATSDAEKLDSLLKEVSTGDESLQEMLSALSISAGLYDDLEDKPEEDIGKSDKTNEFNVTLVFESLKEYNSYRESLVQVSQALGTGSDEETILAALESVVEES